MLGRLVGFSRALRAGGITVNPASLIDLCQCFAYIDITCRDDFYAAARATLISDHAQLAAFDEIFARFWEGPGRVALRRRGEEDADEQSQPESRDMHHARRRESGSGGGDARPDHVHLAYSPDELLMNRDLGTLSADDIERARRLIKQLVVSIANRMSRRYERRRRGRVLDFRRTLRRDALYAQDGITALNYRTRRIKRAKLVLLCDVSGSMQRYSSFLLQFIYGLRREVPDLEAAVFSTRMTVISEYLASKNVDESLEQVGGYVHDWAGGTNIGASIREFNDRFARTMLRSRSAVIVLSDGWDRGDAELMVTEMKRLRRRAYRLLWLNPLLGSPDYRPLCRGMQTALPYLDYFLPAHNLQSLTQLARTLRTLWH